MEAKLPADSAAVKRLRAAFNLQNRFRISDDDVAPVLGLSVRAYHSRLKRAGLVRLKYQTFNGRVIDTDEILTKINAELIVLTQQEGLPDKASVDALPALAKALKSIADISKETPADAGKISADLQDGQEYGLKLGDVREALRLIDCRINEIACERAAVSRTGAEINLNRPVKAGGIK